MVGRVGQITLLLGTLRLARKARVLFAARLTVLQTATLREAALTQNEVLLGPGFFWSSTFSLLAAHFSSKKKLCVCVCVCRQRLKKRQTQRVTAELSTLFASTAAKKSSQLIYSLTDKQSFSCRQLDSAQLEHLHKCR